MRRLRRLFCCFRSIDSTRTCERAYKCINARRAARADALGLFFSCLINRLIKSDKLYLSCHPAILLYVASMIFPASVRQLLSRRRALLRRVYLQFFTAFRSLDWKHGISRILPFFNLTGSRNDNLSASAETIRHGDEKRSWSLQSRESFWLECFWLC